LQDTQHDAGAAARVGTGQGAHPAARLAWGFFPRFLGRALTAFKPHHLSAGPPSELAWSLGVPEEWQAGSAGGL